MLIVSSLLQHTISRASTSKSSSRPKVLITNIYISRIIPKIPFELIRWAHLSRPQLGQSGLRVLQQVAEDEAYNYPAAAELFERIRAWAICYRVLALSLSYVYITLQGSIDHNRSSLRSSRLELTDGFKIFMQRKCRGTTYVPYCIDTSMKNLQRTKIHRL